MNASEIRFLDKLKQEHAERAGIVPGKRRWAGEEDIEEGASGYSMDTEDAPADGEEDR